VSRGPVRKIVGRSLVLAFALCLPSGVAASSKCMAISSRHPLPPELEWGADVRRADAASVFVAALRAGVRRIHLSHSAVAELIEPHSKARDGIWFPSILSVSEDDLFIASIFAYGWKPRSESGALTVQAFGSLSDLDVHKDRIAILGAQRDEEGRFSPDGAIVWTGPIRQDPEKLQPVFYSASGPGARDFSACARMETGTIRFLADGSFLLVPGVEPDVYHYSAEGKLLGTWTSEAAGFDAKCDITEEEMYKLSVDEPGRWAWVNARRTVDEILPLPDAPGLLVRAVEDGKTSWRLRRLGPGGAVDDACGVVLTADSELAHVRGDIGDGGEVVLLLFYKGYTKKTPHPPAHPELLRMRYGSP